MKHHGIPVEIQTSTNSQRLYLLLHEQVTSYGAMAANPTQTTTDKLLMH